MTGLTDTDVGAGLHWSVYVYTNDDVLAESPLWLVLLCWAYVGDDDYIVPMVGPLEDCAVRSGGAVLVDEIKVVMV